ncbi:MAG: hypothetical protein ACR2PI_03925 [Hyphomicrobiaceae bacterium]
MSQAYPQFTPVQILEAGQRAFSEGRTEYAAQFFKHLIDHYSDTPEAAVARDAMVQVNGAMAQPAAPRYAQPNGAQQAAGTPAQPSPGYAQSTAANGSMQGVPLSVNGAGGAQANGHVQAGYASNGHPANGAQGPQGPQGAQGYEPNGYAPSQRGVGQQPNVMPQHSRQADGMPRQQRQAPAHQAEASTRAAVASRTRDLPNLEKSYIIGRVIAGLLLLIGILGIFAGIVLIYAAISDPAIFARFGIATPAAALMFSVAIFVGSILALIMAQVATALFDGADAVADLSRLERFRAGETDDYDD